jgi:cell division protein FtsB
VFAGLMGYFLFHMVTGQQGLVSWLQMGARAEALERQASELASRRAELTALHQRLVGDGAGGDLIEEQAWQQLALVHPGDVVISLEGVNPAIARPASPQPVAIGESSAAVRQDSMPGQSSPSARASSE